MTDSFGRFYLPQMPLAERHEHDRNNIDDRRGAVQKLIATCRNPKVRHRIAFFARKFETLIETYGDPDHVCLEFVREGFIGEKRKKKYEAQANAGREDKKQAITILKEAGEETSDKRIEKARLMREQKCICVYTGKSLCMTDIDHYEIDHILPQSKRGPDSLYNKVLTHRDFNTNVKKDKIPYEVPSIRKYWESYVSRVETIKDKKKRTLLLATSLEEAQAEAGKYTGLAVTAEISRLVRDIICLRMGWQPGERDVERRISVISGGLTHRVAVTYGVYTALGDGNSDRYAKNRDDERHHALDAMIISFLPEWARDENKTAFFKLPEGIGKEYFAEKLKTIYPYKVVKQKAGIAEQPLAQRTIWNAQTKKYDIHMFQRKEGKLKKIGNYSSEFYQNLRKGKKAGRGQWYTSRSVSGAGTMTHGCLLVYSPDSKGTEIIRPVHAHTSPYKLIRSYEGQGKKVRLLRSGDKIEIHNNNHVTATQIGGKTDIRKPEFGEYSIKKNTQKITILCIRTMQI